MERDIVKHAVVSSKELGTRCWLPARFVDGVRCKRVMRCTYPEKKTCKAVTVEVLHLNAQMIECQKRIGENIGRLVKSIES